MIDCGYWLDSECKLVGESAKHFLIWQVNFLEGPRQSATGGWACLVDCYQTYPEDHLTSQGFEVIGSGGQVKMQEGANKLLLLDERDGGGKSKRHVPHHSFAQRLYSKLHLYLASLANLNL